MGSVGALALYVRHQDRISFPPQQNDARGGALRSSLKETSGFVVRPGPRPRRGGRPYFGGKGQDWRILGCSACSVIFYTARHSVSARQYIASHPPFLPVDPMGLGCACRFGVRGRDFCFTTPAQTPRRRAIFLLLLLPPHGPRALQFRGSPYPLHIYVLVSGPSEIKSPDDTGLPLTTASKSLAPRAKQTTPQPPAGAMPLRPPSILASTMRDFRKIPKFSSHITKIHQSSISLFYRPCD